ncbi:MAG: hypothetical protein KAX15_07705 [Candidatus Omnitrophica bacterium]|nr:hypothetical protein [Candidatus Omnitrophota bacterium]
MCKKKSNIKKECEDIIKKCQCNIKYFKKEADISEELNKENRVMIKYYEDKIDFIGGKGISESRGEEEFKKDVDKKRFNIKLNLALIDFHKFKISIHEPLTRLYRGQERYYRRLLKEYTELLFLLGGQKQNPGISGDP